MLVQKLREEADLVSWQLISKEPEQPSQKKQKALRKLRREN
jgi:hypothetical protein